LKRQVTFRGWNETPPPLQYEVVAFHTCEPMALQMAEKWPERFRYHKTKWGHFDGGLTDHIEIGGFTPKNQIRGRHILFLVRAPFLLSADRRAQAEFHNNDVTLSQLHVLVVLLQSFIKSLTVVLPFYPSGTMERTVKSETLARLVAHPTPREGVVATANTTAQILSGLPSCGQPTRLIVYDLHTLQNRFFWNNHMISDLCTSVPLIRKTLEENKKNPEHPVVDCIAFPDDGSAARRGS
jgi:hypothetical protein